MKLTRPTSMFNCFYFSNMADKVADSLALHSKNSLGCNPPADRVLSVCVSSHSEKTCRSSELEIVNFP